MNTYRKMKFKDSLSKTLWPEICQVGQIWTTVWLKKHQEESVSIYGKFKFNDLLDRNMLCR